MFLAPQSILWSRADTLAEQPLIKLMPARYAELLAATEGLKRAGVPLVSAYGDSLAPTAAYLDDVGTYLFVPNLATLLGVSPASAWDLFFLLIFAPCFAIGFVGMMKRLSSPISKGFFAVLHLLLAVVTLLSGNIYLLFPSLTLAIMPFFLSFSESESPLAAGHIAWFMGFGAIVATAHFLRAHSGTAVLLACLILFAFEKKWIWRHKAFALAAVAAGGLLVAGFFNRQIAARDDYFAQRQPNYVAPESRHVFWHVVYVGFGFLDNPFGIRYADSVAYQKAQTLSPNVLLLGEEYERIMKEQTLELVKREPMFVFRTFAAKAGVMGFYLLAFMNVGLYCALYYPMGWQRHLALLSGMAFNSLPGFIAEPNIPFLTGSFAFAIIYASLQLDHAVKQGFLSGVLKKIAT